jgi:phage gp46-like protein
MSDLAISFDPISGFWDLELLDRDLVLDDGFGSAVFMSLLSDALITQPDALPNGDLDRRGYWGDTFQPLRGDWTGSRVWAVLRSKKTPSTVREFRDAAAASLEWMVEDGITDSIDVSIISAPEPADFGLDVRINRPERSESFRFALNWNAEELRSIDV